MRKYILIGLLLFQVLKVNCQVNISDSTTMVVAYWEKGETKSYIITRNTMRIMRGDTVFSDTSNFKVDLTILDSSRKGYIINWHYHDFTIESDNEMQNKQTKLIPDLIVEIRTDELGVFEEVVNWKQLRSDVMDGAMKMKEELKDSPYIDQIIEGYNKAYKSKQTIEATAIKEILQFYDYFGLKYTLGKEYASNKKVASKYGGKPLDSEVICWLDVINKKEDFAVYGMRQLVDSIQLKEETVKNMKKMDEKNHTNYALPEEDYPAITDESWGAAKINGDGWVLYSKLINEVAIGTLILTEECVIKSED